MFSRQRFAWQISIREMLLLVLLAGMSLAFLRQRAAAQTETAQTLAAMGCELHYEPRFGWIPGSDRSADDLSYHCWHSLSKVTVFDDDHTEYYLEAINRFPTLKTVELRFSPGGCGLSHASYNQAVEEFKAGLPKQLKLIVTWVVIPVVG